MTVRLWQVQAEGVHHLCQQLPELLVLLEFQAHDVDNERARLGDQVEVLQEPVTLPWGSRTRMLADPDRNRVNIYTPHTEQAKSRFADR